MKESKDRKLNLWMRILFVFYGISMLYFLFFADAMGRISTDTAYGYNVILFKEISRYIVNWERIGIWMVLLNLGGNIIGFIPMGFLLPFISHKNRNFFRTILSCFLITLVVELVQLTFHVGCFDVDDMLLNVLGGIIGYFIFMMGSFYRRKQNEQKKKTKKL